MAPKKARPSIPTMIDPITDGVILSKPEHLDNYRRLASGTSLHTTYFDDKMLDTLGLREGVEYMAENIGWTQFLKMKEPAYRSLTFEFLSTLEVVGPAQDRMTFRLGNRDRELTLPQLNAIFGFRPGGCRRECGPPDSVFDPSWHWEQIAEVRCTSGYDGKTSRAIDIFNPCIRLMHQFVAPTIFGRELPEYATVKPGEVLFLWSMCYIDKFKLNRGKLDTGCFLVNHLKKVSSKGSPKVIFVGGIITSIARYFKIRLDNLQPMNISWITINTCLKDLDIIFKYHGRYYLNVRCCGNSRDFPLPDVTITNVQKWENWKCTYLNNGTWGNIYPDSEDDEVEADNNGDYAEEVEEDKQDAFGSVSGSTSSPSLESILARVENIERKLQRLDNIENMIQQMYNWHVRQGHFLPSPPLPRTQ